MVGLPVGLFTCSFTVVAMEEQETVIGEVIGQFYSFFGGLMTLRETVTSSPGISQSVRDHLLGQLAELEGECVCRCLFSWGVLKLLWLGRAH